jgi:hypothetical protein
VCVGNPLKLVDTVRSFFNNYTHQQWQTSTDGGLTWTNLGIARDSVPFFNAALNVWEYWSRYTTPIATLADNGRKFRLVVATSTTNLTDDNCRSTDPMNNVTVNVLDCGPVLDTRLISFNGKVSNAKATLQWTTTGEKEPMLFDVEKSVDGSNFTLLGTVNSSNTNPSELNHYSFTDPNDISGLAHYRINMRTIDNKAAYSRILQLSGKQDLFAFGAVINPFNHVLFFDISTAKAGIVKAELVDQLGNTVRRKSFETREGMNSLAFDNTNVLPNGVYVLRVELAGMIIYKKVMKTI